MNLQDLRQLNNTLVSKLNKAECIYINNLMNFTLSIEKTHALVELSLNDADYLQNGYDLEDIQYRILEEIEPDIKEGYLCLNTLKTFKLYASSLDLHSLHYLDNNEILSKFNTLPELADLNVCIEVPDKEHNLLIKMYTSECTNLINMLRRMETETNYLLKELTNLKIEKEKEFQQQLWKSNIDLEIVISVILELQKTCRIEPLGTAPRYFSSNDKMFKFTEENKKQLCDWSKAQIIPINTSFRMFN